MIKYRITWTQVYTNWEPYEMPITNLSEANAVLQRIMKL